MDPEAATPGEKHCIVVSPRQRGNPLIRHFVNVTCVEGDTPYDYKLTEGIQALFLSLKYHRMHRGYIGARLKQLRGHRVKNPFIVCQVDIEDPQDTIAELTVITFTLGYRLLLSWSPRESAAVLEALKIDGHKGLEFLNPRLEQPHLQIVQRIIASVKHVNNTDAITIASRCNTVKQLMHIKSDQLENIHGLGKRKVKSILAAFNDAFF
ncbi:-DNA excision repair protein ERCC-1 [Babesia bigemina]|uniref:-DNA excision repair protein ERCC-1 n=1 Tax=Babesia bigemina TaxID=5866 RepID=A0A061DCQ4_BABBI|nr:-DNA excision repair protein ERCC-1 [Babesia bigemina]CDR97937.1 -DNA excision repair protein ERCC-1 [Babesia bigemina]|eukprot:XP_012770123.1 -DNA excision repair protein ERCC-1 [Babesia bigemina]